MRLRAWMASLVGVLVIAGAVAWWLHTYKREERWIDLPRTGEAASNPLFALRVALEKDGRTVHPWRRLDPVAMELSPNDTVLFDGDLRVLSTLTRARLLNWLRSGGHLIVAVPPPDAAADVFESADRTYLRVPLLDAFDVRVHRRPTGCITGVDAPAALCGTRRFAVPRGTSPHLGDADGDVFARIPVGRGRVDVLGSLDFVTTDSLSARANRDFTAELFAADERGGTVHLVHASDLPSLWLTLLRHGWPAWLPFALLLAGWLWARMRRFGPLLPPPALERRSLLEHVAASGAHQWRYGRAGALYDAMLASTLDRLRRRDPQAAALDGEPQLVLLVERLKLPAAQLRDVLRRPDPRDAKALVARIATLVRMRNRL
ncbi:DUF4350 domain-containing protein [Cognatilysobacter lacus]|uniref:DUF4350 domain-containing protein n=1 Tax=Cognatilysobacter lacus TaxID=1643323 RepID=A0A5D8YPJ2_9GAMM|nr:DUF4350 domain-containing protein [Lysobacter lacus]TZF84369.1 DUF4350 domain-containing protein [Lysobacter lacus]